MSLGVGFDFDHTLGKDHGLERRALEQLAAELGAPISDADPRYHLLIDEVLAPFRRAELPMAGMIRRFVAALPGSPAVGDAEALAAEYRRLCYQLVDELVEPIDGAVEIITELSAHGIALGILTNGWSPLQEKKIARALGAFPGPILVSDTIGAYKPSAAAFRRLERTLGCPATDLWYVGDNPEVDIGGAKACGLRAVWFDWEGLAYPPELPPPDARITRLTDLIPVLQVREL
jgi:putative hydrolase of the HAD superfamily